MSETTKQPPPRYEELNDLARQIREAHDQCLASFRTGVGHARRARDLLNRAKEKLGKRGKWESWLKENCSFKLRMAQNYMRIASHYKEVEEKQGPVDGLTMTQLLAVIKQMEEEEDEATGAGTTEQAREGGVGTDQARRATSSLSAPTPSSNDPDAAYRLPEGGYKLKRQEVDARRAEGELTIEEDAKLARFVEQKLETIYKILRREARKELADLASDSKLDLGHLAIVVS